ncbi:pyridoxal 5'-phosphate synthase glutaminase subunit PdxT [Candidatus Gracilibacteria bacterium]|nr:pyridoxal 5'-phosphate synthase glutaminase subunit PdxT [Candidatus Gracilibacteria bacterium]
MKTITKKLVTIGVLDIQGSVEEHMAMLKKLGIPHRGVKTLEALEEVDGLIMPGGESTTIGKLLKLYKLDEAIKKRVKAKTLAVWGTCAGAILLAKKVEHPRPDILELMDIEIVRNAYGRQLNSFIGELSIPAAGKKPVPAVFIRAPIIKKVGKKVEILAQYEGIPMLVREENMLAGSFHPELTSDTRVHALFTNITKEYARRL